MMTHHHYDLIIIGAGLVGAGLAAALQSQSPNTAWRIAIVDARVPNHQDPRLFALNYASCEFLKKIKIWDELVEHAAPIQQVHVSRRGHFGAVRLKQEDLSIIPNGNTSYLGQVIPAYLIEKTIDEKLAAIASITFYRPATLTSLQQDTEQVTLTLQIETRETKKEITLTAPFVIGADGVHSTVRAQCHIATEEVDYQQSAIVTRVALARSHHNIAYERFYQHGAMAMLPLVGSECAMIWSGDQQIISQLMTLTDEEFLQALQQTFGTRLGKLVSIKQRHQFPLHMVRAKKNRAGRVLLLGNAAHTLHPIAAQGFNLALTEVVLLADDILQKMNDHHNNQNKIYSLFDFEKISEKMLQQQQLSITLSHQLAKRMTDSSILLKWAISLGFVALDKCSPLKKKFLARMMGRQTH